MASPYNHGLITGSCLAAVYNSEEGLSILRTPHIFFKDYYESYWKKFGFEREDMLVVMCDICKVDPLVGTEVLPYLEPPTKLNFKK